MKLHMTLIQQYLTLEMNTAKPYKEGLFWMKVLMVKKQIVRHQKEMLKRRLK